MLKTNPKEYAYIHHEELFDTIRAAAARERIDTDSSDTTMNKKYRTIDEVMLSFQNINDKFVADSLRYLFSSHLGDHINIKHKESYYRYFSGQLRKIQLTNLEVEQILCYDEKDFQEQIKIIRETNKTDSFITRIMTWSKKWKNSPIVFLRNICLFIEDDFRNEFIIKIIKCFFFIIMKSMNHF